MILFCVSTQDMNHALNVVFLSSSFLLSWTWPVTAKTKGAIKDETPLSDPNELHTPVQGCCLTAGPLHVHGSHTSACIDMLCSSTLPNNDQMFQQSVCLQLIHLHLVKKKKKMQCSTNSPQVCVLLADGGDRRRSKRPFLFCRAPWQLKPKQNHTNFMTWTIT